MRAGYDVRAFVLYNSFNSWGWLDNCAAEVSGKFDVFAGDIRDPNGVRTAMKGCDAVLHLAALIAIPYSYHSPDTYVDTNIKGTLNIVQAARDLGVGQGDSYLDERSVRHGAFRADHRGASAAGSVSLFGQQNRRRSNRDVFLHVLWNAGDDLATVQHLRTAPIGACGDSHDHYANRERQAADQARRTASDARLQFRHRHGGGVRHGACLVRGSRARSSISAATSRSPSAIRRDMSSPKSWAPRSR